MLARLRSLQKTTTIHPCYLRLGTPWAFFPLNYSATERLLP
jgi:hypothetical protein